MRRWVETRIVRANGDDGGWDNVIIIHDEEKVDQVCPIFWRKSFFEATQTNVGLRKMIEVLELTAGDALRVRTEERL